MIVPMKKVSLIVLKKNKEDALNKLRKLGLLHIEITEGEGTKLLELKEQTALLENGIYTLSAKADKNTESKDITLTDAIALSQRIEVLTEQQKSLYNAISSYTAELERLKAWGEINLHELDILAAKGIDITLYNMPLKEYKAFKEIATTIVLSSTKPSVKLVALNTGETDLSVYNAFKVELPKKSTGEMVREIDDFKQKILDIENQIAADTCYIEGMKKALEELKRETEFQTYSSGMSGEDLSENGEKQVSIAYFDGYIPTEDLDKLKDSAKENAWGLIISDPTEEDNAPTKLKNNKFVSLIYPLTDFLGTVPGYFEYDISGWFIGFILIFFGIIFGDGGYGLLICAVAAALILKAKLSKRVVPPAFILILLFGGATVLWGTLTCTWFGLPAESLPNFIKSLSIPVISNVYSDKLWYPFWTGGKAALTTAQNVQILCFALALVQLTVAHIKGFLRNRKTLKCLGDLGSILQLVGMFYVVMALVVNGQVFSLSLVVAGIPVGTIAIAFVLIGFAMSFVFANYEGSIIKSVLDSLKNIVSVLLGVVNIFSDIVSYIRLWAVGLAGAAISATVNELAGPMLGNFMFMIFAIILLVFGHGLNMILNVLSVIVHGVRLNTLEFSSHLDMSWGGHKYEPFKE
ncbi:MAG: ATPase [Clostridia bacterium]|nr:ATPase [Clostridia bacterium]